MISRKRVVVVDVLIGVTTILLILAVFSVWANRLLFNPTNWSNTSTQLLQNPTIRDTTSNYVIDQLYANVNVSGLIKSGLPPQLQGLAAPAAGALRNVAVQGVDLALQRPRVQELWRRANYAADKTFIAIANGGKGAVGVNQGAVTLNLASVVNEVAARLGLPANLGAKLPPSVAHLTVFKSNQIKSVQKGGKAIKGLALILTILVPVLYALAVLLARGHRRRTLMDIGFAAIVGGVIAFLLRRVLEAQLAAALTNDATLRPAITATVAIGTDMIRDIAGACVFVGVIFVGAAWFAGPASVCRSARRAMAPFLRDHAGATYGIAIAVLALVFAWDPIPATGKPAGMIVFTILTLIGVEVLRRQTAREFPEARPGDATLAIRTQMHRRREARTATAAPSAAAGPATADHLKELAALHESGALSTEEFKAAKAQVLKD